MKRRLAITLVLVLGLVPVAPATSFATLSDSGNAAEVQYPDVPEERESGNAGLPVTGYVAIPILAVGAVLLLVGGVMRVRTRRE